MITSLVLYLTCLVLAHSQQCSTSCFSDTIEGGDSRFPGRCIQFYQQSSRVNLSCSSWHPEYSKKTYGIGEFFDHMFPLEWGNMGDALKSTPSTCLSTNLEELVSTFNKKMVIDRDTNIDVNDGKIGQLKLTCPIGLFNGFLCLSAASIMDCAGNDGTDPVTTCGALPHICQDDVRALIELCSEDDPAWLSHDDVEQSLTKLMPVSSDRPCSPPEFIYLGQPSNRVVDKSLIVMTCLSETSAELRCFKDGSVVTSTEWMYNGTSIGSNGGVVTINAKKGMHHLVNGEYSCLDREEEVTMEVNFHCHLKETVDSTKFAELWGGGESLDAIHVWDEWELPYAGNDGKEVNNTVLLSELNALDNTDYYHTHLSVVHLSMQGRLTPVCGEGWNMAAGKVFCRELGNRANQNWTAEFVR